MKRIIITSFLLASVAAVTGCTDKANQPVNNLGDNSPSSVSSNDENRSAAAGVAGTNNPNTTGIPDTNDKGTVATDMRVSGSTTDEVGNRSAAPSNPNAMGSQPGSHDSDLNARGANSTDTRTQRSAPSASDAGGGL